MIARLARFARDRRGTATVEFCILFLPLVVMMMSGAEAGLLNLRRVMLERGTDITVRAIRLGPDRAPTHAQVKRMICDHAMVIPDCERSLKIEMRSVSPADWGMISPAADCADRAQRINPADRFVPGRPSDLMLIRVCLKADPMFPTTGLGLMMPKDSNGDYTAIVTAAFVNEP